MKNFFIFILILLLFPVLFIRFQTDADVYAYMGRLLVNGYIPYIDGWDHKGISLYFINAIGYLIGFKSITGIKILEVLLIGYSFLTFYKTLSKKYSEIIAFISMTVGVFTLKYFFDGGNLTEEYGVIFVLISLSLFLKNQLKTIDYAIIGALFVVNLTIRANLISFWGVLFLVYCLQLILKTISLKNFLLSFLRMSYGAITIIGVYFIYFLSTGSLQHFIDAAFIFNFSYSNATLASTFDAILTSVTRYHLSFIFLIGFIVSIIRFFKDKTRTLELILIFWIPLELYFSNMSNRLYAHYFLMWIPMLILSCAVIINDLKERFKFSNKKILITSFLLFMICFYVPIYMTFMNYKTIVFGNETSKSEKISNHIINNYKDHTLLVWGNNSEIYNLTNKISPISSFYQSTFKYDTELVRNKINAFSKQILDKKPSLIIDAKRNGMLHLDLFNKVVIDDSQKRNLKEFSSIIKTQYVFEEEKFGIDFYILVNNE
tara:strand:+ start:10172 stop:11638 length:1467 start_codon:yes stop_codon:yes gene_type:complete